jgi:hypothetical protein
MARSRPERPIGNRVAPGVYPTRSRIAETRNRPGFGERRVSRTHSTIFRARPERPASRPPAGGRRALRQPIPMAATSTAHTEGDRRAVRFASGLNTVQRAVVKPTSGLSDRARLRRPGPGRWLRNRYRDQCAPFADAPTTNPVTDSRSTTRKRRRVTSHGSGHTPCTQGGFTVSPFQRRYRANAVERKRCPEQPRSAVPSNDQPRAVGTTWFSSEKFGHESQRYSRGRQRAMSQSS